MLLEYQRRSEVLHSRTEADFGGELALLFLVLIKNTSFEDLLKNRNCLQLKKIQSHYGRKDETSEEKVKEIFKSKEVNLTERFNKFEEESFTKLNGLIDQIDESSGLKKDLFRAFLAKIYKRIK
jgi:hypothetical protein